jgi:HEAT repeat protein
VLGSAGEECVRAEPKADSDAALSKRIDQLIRQLGARRFAERERAAKDLIEIGAPALEPLRKATKDPDAEIARRATECIPAIELNIKVAGLAAGLRGEHPEERIKAANALMRLGESARGAVPDLVRALDDADTKVRVRVIVALWNIGPDSKPAIPTLIAFLKDKQAHEDLRWSSATCLGYIGPAAAEAAPLLLDMLATEGPRLRRAAVNGLRGIGDADERVIPALIKVLDDADSGLAIEAAGALGDIGKRPDTVVPALVRLLKKNLADPKESDQERITRRANNRRGLIWVLRAFGAGGAPAVPILMEIVKDEWEAPEMRVSAIRALAWIGPKAKEAIPALEPLLNKDERRPELAEEVAKALKAIARPDQR